MRCVEKIGLIKFDFLGLSDADDHRRRRAARARGHPRPTSASTKIPYDDATTYEPAVGTGNTEGVFQVESGGMTDLVVKLKPRSFKELIPIVALYRPGPSAPGWWTTSSTARTASRRSSTCCPSSRSSPPRRSGVIVYQDQVLQIANRLAGYSLGEADLLRRAMGKKKPEEMDQAAGALRDGATSSAASTRSQGRGGLRR